MRRYWYFCIILIEGDFAFSVLIILGVTSKYPRISSKSIILNNAQHLFGMVSIFSERFSHTAAASWSWHWVWWQASVISWCLFIYIPLILVWTFYGNYDSLGVLLFLCWNLLFWSFITHGSTVFFGVPLVSTWFDGLPLRWPWCCLSSPLWKNFRFWFPSSFT